MTGLQRGPACPNSFFCNIIAPQDGTLGARHASEKEACFLRLLELVGLQIRSTIDAKALMFNFVQAQSQKPTLHDIDPELKTLIEVSTIAESWMIR